MWTLINSLSLDSNQRLQMVETKISNKNCKKTPLLGKLKKKSSFEICVKEWKAGGLNNESFTSENSFVHFSELNGKVFQFLLPSGDDEKLIE